MITTERAIPFVHNPLIGSLSQDSYFLWQILPCNVDDIPGLSYVEKVVCSLRGCRKTLCSRLIISACYVLPLGQPVVTY
ncbi:hypothetical protein FHW74_000418 [Atlantibacter sp. RC6]|nr:hypothetical protein [Atlantibacter sp. RC6]